MANDLERIPYLISQAVMALNKATTAAEVLDAHSQATIAYDAAKLAARFEKIKGAHETVLTACRKMQADALVIEARAQCRLADEYDAAQARGEVRKDGQRRPHKEAIPNENSLSSVTDIGLTSKQIHAARKIRDAEKQKPGVVREILDEKLEAGQEPTRADVKHAVNGLVKPKGKGGPKPNQRKFPPEKTELVGSLVLDEGKTYDEAGAEVGVSNIVVRTSVAREEGRRQGKAEAEIDPSSLSMSAQQKLEVAIRQHKRKLDLEFEQRVLRECRERIESTILPSYTASYAEYNEVIKARKGIMERSAYKKILSCLHPDRVTDEGLKKRYEDAFNIFSRLEKRLLDEKESPTASMQMPRTYEELMALKRKVAEGRKARRSHQNVAQR